METSEVKEEVVYFADLKVKEEDSSSVVYDVEVTSNLDVKPKQEDTQQNLPISITNEKDKIFLDIEVNPDRYPTSNDAELELESKNSSSVESENDSESDSGKELQRKTPGGLQASSSRNKRNTTKRKKRSVKNQERELLQCTLCPRSYPKVELLLIHARTEHAKVQNPNSDPISDDEDETSSQCPLCSKSLKSNYTLKMHFLNFHIKNKSFECSVCLESKNEIRKFPTESSLTKHIKKVHDLVRFKFQCYICPIKCKNLFEYENHKETHLEKKYKCEYCSNGYRGKEAMLRHIIAVHKEYTDRHETFKCDLCDQLFCSQKELDRHVLQTHEENTVQCKFCLKKFREEVELRKHLDFGHWENRTWLVCDVCSTVFKNNQNLVEHLEMVHQRFFKCRKCFRSFVSKEDYDSHSTEILDQKGRKIKRPSLQCKICLVFLNTECVFSTHKGTHLETGEIGSKNIVQLQPGVSPEIECDFCRMLFRKKSLALEHAMKCHPNDKWECKSCDKSFKLKYQLAKHEVIHFKGKPFKCKKCHKSFPFLNYLQKHEKIHKKDKGYKCSCCNKSFVYSARLRLHMANHHGAAKPFKCHICQLAFADRKTLDEHLITNRVEGPFGCKKCSHRYNSVKQLRYHQQRYHSENAIAPHNMGNRKDRSYPARVGPYLKYLEDLVYVCIMEECNFETKDEKEVAIHNAMHGLPRLFLSRVLPPTSSVKSLDSSSSTLTFREKIRKRMVQPRLKCKYCFKAYGLSSSLRDHMKKFHPASLVAQKKTVHQSHERKKYTCFQCEKSFTSNPGLNYHIVSYHRCEKPFKCDICKKAFAVKGSLVQHFRSHTNERPFSCSECSYSGKCVEQLKRHLQRMHAENLSIKYEKPWLNFARREPRSKYAQNLVFVCCGEDCDFETKVAREVAKHYEKHNLPKVNVPKLFHGPASQVFVSKFTPTKKHLIVTRYKCNNCSMTFSTPSCLQRHMREIHMMM